MNRPCIWRSSYPLMIERGRRPCRPPIDTLVAGARIPATRSSIIQAEAPADARDFRTVYRRRVSLPLWWRLPAAAAAASTPKPGCVIGVEIGLQAGGKHIRASPCGRVGVSVVAAVVLKVVPPTLTSSVFPKPRASGECSFSYISCLYTAGRKMLLAAPVERGFDSLHKKTRLRFRA